MYVSDQIRIVPVHVVSRSLVITSRKAFCVLPQVDNRTLDMNVLDWPLKQGRSLTY